MVTMRRMMVFSVTMRGRVVLNIEETAPLVKSLAIGINYLGPSSSRI